MTMLNSLEIRKLIALGMVHQEAVPNALQTPRLMTTLVEAWNRQLDAEGGYFDLTVGGFFELSGKCMPELGPGEMDRIEPKVTPIDWTQDDAGPYVVLQPGEFVLFRTREQLKIPPHITVRLDRKSSLHRCGVDVIASPAHAGYEGFLTIAAKVIGPLPIRIRYGARMLTSSFYRVDPAATKQYDGPHQGGTVTSGGEAIRSY